MKKGLHLLVNITLGLVPGSVNAAYFGLHSSSIPTLNDSFCFLIGQIVPAGKIHLHPHTSLVINIREVRRN
ncbi:MAG TPA: hypothetical protein VGA29_07715, partial [Ignavibacteriaceae bacterium]